MANKGLKTANIPLVNEMKIPKGVLESKNLCVIGLITELYISYKKFNFPLKDVLTVKEHLKKYFSLIQLQEDDIMNIYDLMVYDKKN